MFKFFLVSSIGNFAVAGSIVGTSLAITSNQIDKNSTSVDEQEFNIQFNKIDDVDSTETSDQLDYLLGSSLVDTIFTMQQLGIENAWNLPSNYDVVISLNNDASIFDGKELSVKVKLSSGLLTKSKNIYIYPDLPPIFVVDTEKDWDGSKISTDLNQGTLNLVATNDPNAQQWEIEIQNAIQAYDEIDGFIIPTYIWDPPFNPNPTFSPGTHYFRYVLRASVFDSKNNESIFALTVTVIQ